MASAEEACNIRLEGRDSQGSAFSAQKIAEFHTQETSGNAKAYPVGENAQALPYFNGNPNVQVVAGSRVYLLAQSDTADTVESEESNGTIPGFLVNESTGQRVQKDLRVGDTNGDFTDFNGTDDIALVTTQYNILGYYAVFSVRYR